MVTKNDSLQLPVVTFKTSLVRAKPVDDPAFTARSELLVTDVKGQAIVDQKELQLYLKVEECLQELIDGQGYVDIIHRPRNYTRMQNVLMKGLSDFIWGDERQNDVY